MDFPHPIVTIEEHWLSQSTRDLYAARGAKDPNDENGIVGKITPTLMEFGEKRLQAMGEGAVSMQVVSHVSNSIALDAATCVKVNDELSSHTKRYPGRFAAFAALPMAEPQAASAELRRCVRELGFVGTMIDSNCEGRYYDDSFFWPVFEAAEELDVPVYIHPAPNEKTEHLFQGNYPAPVGETLSQFGWGWHAETAVLFLRLFAAGLFERHPKLKIVLGHLGELLPFQLDRIDHITARVWPHFGVKLERTLRQVWDENVWVAISGVFFMAPMAAVLKLCKPDRVIHAVDYPFGNNEAGLKFLKALRSEGMVSDGVLGMIAYKNAESLLKLKVHT